MIVRPGNLQTVASSASAVSDEFAIDCSWSADKSKLLLNVSTFEIEVRDAELRRQLRFSAHSDRITAACFSRQSSDLIYTSSADCTVKTWDTRLGSNPSAIIKFETDVFALTSNNMDNLLVVGVENNVVFYDRRMLQGNVNSRNCLGVYSDVHTNEITQLVFHPSHHHLLASSAEDGLICMYNVGTAEAGDAVVSIMNTDCTVNKFGFFGPNGDGLYSISSIETLSIWHHPSAQRLYSFDDIRDTTGVDYLIDCFETSADEELFLFAGSHTGEIDIIGVQPSSYRTLGTRLIGHTSTIRAICPVPTLSPGGKGLAAVSVGEDGKICSYNNVVNDPSDSNQAPIGAPAQSMGRQKAGAVKRDHSHELRFSPYKR